VIVVQVLIVLFLFAMICVCRGEIARVDGEMGKLRQELFDLRKVKP